MIVECEQCFTTFKLDESRIKGERAKVRCSRCGFVFTVQKPEVENKEDVSWAEMEPAPDQEEAARRQAPAFSEEELSSAVLLRKKRRAAGSKRFILPILCLVAIVAAGWGAYTYFVRDLPKPAAPVQQPGEENSSLKNINLSSAEGFFKENKAAGTLFVIKGVARNKNDFPVSFIKLRGILHDTNAKEVMEREVYAGNMFSDEELADLSIDKIKARSENKYGLDNANYNIPPGGTVSYMIVFNNIPDNLAEYTVKVVDSSSNTPSSG
jgi:predicted Zn finger-like uncharacterized protein